MVSVMSRPAAATSGPMVSSSQLIVIHRDRRGPVCVNARMPLSAQTKNEGLQCHSLTRIHTLCTDEEEGPAVSLSHEEKHTHTHTL